LPAVRLLPRLPQEGDVAFFGQKLVGCQAERCWQEVWESSAYPERRKAVEEFNKGGPAPALIR
jgi:xanthine dehydrogenase molybdopterin-binding subunit B